MMTWTFFNDGRTACMYPLGPSHHNGALRVGALTIEELWEGRVIEYITKTEQAIAQKVHFAMSNGALNDRWLPSDNAFSALATLPVGVDLWHKDTVLFKWISSEATPSHSHQLINEADLLSAPHNLFTRAGEWIQEQALQVSSLWNAQNARQIALPEHVKVIGPLEHCIIAPGARMQACTINTENGPVLLGPGSEIQEGCNVRGPLYLGARSVLKMGCKIYGPTSIGDECRIGGEISNAVFLGYSNKGHDGFLGNSVIGKWCNLGAATNTSNLKSNYSTVRLWSDQTKKFEESGLQFCGLIMGDHSKSGINTMFNTGTVVGPGCNIFGGGFQPKHIPSFSWGGGTEWSTHELDKFLQTARSVMARRGCELTDAEIEHWTSEQLAAQNRA